MSCQIAKGHTLWKDVNRFEKQKMAEPQTMIYNDAIYQAIFKAYTVSYTLHYITLHMRELHPSRMRVYQLWVFTSARMGRVSSLTSNWDYIGTQKRMSKIHRVLAEILPNACRKAIPFLCFETSSDRVHKPHNSPDWDLTTPVISSSWCSFARPFANFDVSKLRHAEDSDSGDVGAEHPQFLRR